MNGAPDPDVLNRALLELASGEPELVVVDARVLRLVFGPLAQLIILRPVGGRSFPADEDGPFIWDDDDLC